MGFDAYTMHTSAITKCWQLAGHLIKIEKIFYSPTAEWPSAANNLIKNFV